MSGLCFWELGEELEEAAVLCCVIEFFFEIEFFWREDGVAISASLSEEEEG